MDRTDAGDGYISLITGLVIAGLGITTGLKKGFTAVGILAMAACIGALILALYEMGNVNDHGLNVGVGLRVILLGALVGGAIALTSLFVKEPR